MWDRILYPPTWVRLDAGAYYKNGSIKAGRVALYQFVIGDREKFVKSLTEKKREGFRDRTFRMVFPLALCVACGRHPDDAPPRVQ